MTGPVVRKVVTGALGAGGLVIAALGAGATPVAASPMCVEFFAENFDSELANHGQHIIGDYIAGMGHEAAWPPAGEVGQLVGGRGPLKPGAPGIQQHGASPGASFCNGSSSPSSPPGSP